jgi:NMD protein affecting ribosome stability and mRNA decay
MNRSYYEAIVQLRPGKGEVRELLEKLVKASGKAHIAKKKNVGAGFDYYLSSWKYAIALGNELVKKFGGQVEVTRKLFGMSKKTGRVVYRGTVLYRSPIFAIGDVILSSKGDIYKITSIVGRRNFVGENLRTRKKDTIKPEERNWKLLKKQKVEISRNLPNLEVINPEDYQSVPVSNSKEVRESRVHVVFYGGYAFLVE